LKFNHGSYKIEEKIHKYFPPAATEISAIQGTGQRPRLTCHKKEMTIDKIIRLRTAFLKKEGGSPSVFNLNACITFVMCVSKV